MNNQLGYTGQLDPGDASGEFNAQSFMVRQILSRVNTATLVKVIAVTNSGGVSPVGFVDVQPLVNQVDGANNSVSHAPLYHLPYFRLQGGTDAIIIDPKAGDIGIAVFADHDITSVKKTKKQSNPGSGARFSMSDGMYIGGVLNGVPVQYVQFTAGGINVVSPSKITCTAPTIEMDAATQFSINSPTIILNGAVNQGSGSYAGNATYAGTVTINVNAIIGGKSFLGHIHSDPQGGNTGPPV